ncbi:hypothetical protein JX266_001337 [Neoarthrinium moseri]|nr:hypothetical protein JX266_001337 [Neoarthrinium moseri]
MDILRRLGRQLVGANSSALPPPPPPPPSYEDSQEAAMRSIVDGSLYLASLAFPDLFETPPGPPDASASSPDIVLRAVLMDLASAPCHGRTYLHRMRQHMGSASISPMTKSQIRQALKYVQSERQLDIGSTREEGKGKGKGKRKGRLQAPAVDTRRAYTITEESMALLLSAQTLQRYYAKQQHRDPSGRSKTRLTELRACSEKCGCFDYDSATTLRQRPGSTDRDRAEADEKHRPETDEDGDTLELCYCRHPASSHANGGPAVSKLLLRYVNWDQRMYAALGHRDASLVRKRYLSQVARCQGDRCGCADYDGRQLSGAGARSSTAGADRRCNCGHSDVLHVPARGAGGRKGAGSRGRREADGDGDGAWILVEAAYLGFDEVKGRTEAFG